ncbi:MAG: isocitrate lyase/phosphoenolpyruvate mutase family protein [Asticcacaulis sp.]|nr:isocitrate lyase/phosphoenolpyruvate mutase family protein [Asticcacaulis sp.]
MTQTQRFRDLHSQPGRILKLPNTWDAGSARLAEHLGAKAIATTSAGVAWSLGYADGNRMPSDQLLNVARNIVRIVKVPVSVDLEGGYDDRPEVVAETVRGFIDAGIAGINIEDGLDDPSVLAAKIGAIKATAAAMGAELFINARCDVYLFGLALEDRRLETTLARAAVYRGAGADGLFVPGLTDPETIRVVAAQAGLPLNLLARPGLAEAATLAELGVARLSAGSGVSQALWKKAGELIAGFLKDGDSDMVTADAMTYADLQKLF